MHRYILNERGQQAARTRLTALVRHGVKPDHWFAEIEDAAQGFDTGDTCGIVIRERYTALGMLETVRLHREWFDTLEIGE